MRLRLTLWFVLGVVLVAVAGGLGTYVIFGGQLRGELDSRLTQQLSRYQMAVASADSEQALAAATEDYLSGSQSNPLRHNAFVFSLQLSDGTVISNSSDTQLEDLAATLILRESGERFLLDIRIGEQSYRVAGTPVMMGETQIGAVEIAGSLATISDALRRLLALLAVGGAIGCLVVGIGSWLLMGRALGPVTRITRTAAAISHEDLSRRIDYEGPSDEIGELAVTMDAMLDRLQSAFAALEQFISDASHELRTPLTVVKGHLQVLDRQETLDPELVKREHALVIDELDRMNRLVSGLLTLARATRADFLHKERIELDAFLQSLAAQGPHLGDRSWIIDSLPGGSVQADQDRLIQVFLNLMQNAVRHTKRGQVIALGGRRTRGQAILWVRDEGEGMAEDETRRVFERFYRGRGGEEKGAGEGLGLAIVQAIIEAHDGSVSVESQPGTGARFTMTLPA